jgi:succinylglutamic semialdehyde dehydrogenase
MGSGDRQPGADQLQESFLDLLIKGGRPIKQLSRPDEGKPFLTPAIIDVTAVEKRSDAELFGPVLQVIRVPDFDAALAEANNTRYGLAASLVGGSPQLYDRFWANVRAGVINWNKPTNGAPSNARSAASASAATTAPSAYYAADYCAYPVTSSRRSRRGRASASGLRDPYAANELEG